MRLLTIGTWSLASSVVFAFRNASPFFYLSTQNQPLGSNQITTSSDLLSAIDSQLLNNSDGVSFCPVHTYIIAIIPDLSLRHPDSGVALPSLRKWFSPEETIYRSKFSVSQVAGKENAEKLVTLLQTRCGRKADRVDLETAPSSGFVYDENQPRLIVWDARHLVKDGISDPGLGTLDGHLSSAIKQFMKREHTIFLIGSPLLISEGHSVAEATSYEMDDSQWPLHMELKRDLSSHKRADNVTLSNGPLFERYQFLTPGIFMGIFTTFTLIAVGYVGIYALGSLQVSYAAFDKENGPQAQKNKAQ